MNIYQRKSRWKIYLLLAGLVILIISMIVTSNLAQKLAEGERARVELWARTMKEIQPSSDEDQSDANFLNQDITYLQDVLSIIKDIPVILVNENGEIADAQNLPANANLEKELLRIQDSGTPPIEGFGYARYIYYKNTPTLTLLSYFPLLQVILFITFIGTGYLLFSSARRAEQDQVWVGMAKETAHQLGTPITAIVAWIEHLRMMKEGDEETEEILVELDKDVERLKLIADRFSKIGSAPELTEIDIYQELDKVRTYMQARSPRKVAFHFPEAGEGPLPVKINPPLFDWVLENLMRNALDAMDGKGSITAEVTTEKEDVIIDVTDTGKGIPSNKFKTVFQPGYTTKKRGWGLGLSLAKRIIESYHSGRIFVKKSVVNQGATFTIRLPKS